MAMAVLPVPGLPARRMARPPIFVVCVDVMVEESIDQHGLIDLKI